jgi:hypothetical protein
MEQISRIGMDTSKHIFQVHRVNAAEKPVLRKKMRSILAGVSTAVSIPPSAQLKKPIPGRGSGTDMLGRSLLDRSAEHKPPNA